MEKGKITAWNDNKGYGFIAPTDGGARIFIHISAFGNRNDRPEINDVVTYSVTQDDDGRTRATSATRSGEKRIVRSGKRPSSSAILLAVVFLAIVGVSAFTNQLPLFVPTVYLILSATAYFAYAWDKAAAKAGRWRTSEGTLHLLALAGGWPGALVAQQTLRHKSRKASFRAVFWVTVLLNCTALVWLHTLEGRSYLRQLMDAVS